MKYFFYMLARKFYNGSGLYGDTGESPISVILQATDAEEARNQAKQLLGPAGVPGSTRKWVVEVVKITEGPTQ